MGPNFLDYRRGPHAKRPRRWTIPMFLAALLVLPVAALLFEEARFRMMMRPAWVCGRTVFQVVTLVGRPQEDHLDENPTSTTRAWTTAFYSPLNHRYSNGRIGYGDPFGEYWYNIEFRNGVAIGVTRSLDVR
jgi:hypothetical protein